MSTIKILVVLIAATALAALGAWAFTRSDIADPAVLAGMNPQDLRDAEVETLVRFAFRNASRVVIRPSAENKAKSVVVTDPKTLNELANIFHAGQDGIRPAFRSPGVLSTKVTIFGRYEANLYFLESTRIRISPVATNKNPNELRFTPVPGKFAVKIGDLLELERLTNIAGAENAK